MTIRIALSYVSSGSCENGNERSCRGGLIAKTGAIVQLHSENVQEDRVFVYTALMAPFPLACGILFTFNPTYKCYDIDLVTGK